MADYDCCNPRSVASSPLETAVSTSQTLPSSTSDSMWEGWTQSTSPVSQYTLSEQLQQQLGGGYSSTTNMKTGSSYQHDLFSSWLMSGYQTVSLNQQQQHHAGEEGSGTTTMYHDEFSRMNICPSTVSSNYDHGVATATGGGSDGSHQLYDVIQTCSSKSELPNEAGESSQFLSNPSSPNGHKFVEGQALHKLDAPLDMNANQKIVNQMNASTELSSRASSSSPPSGLSSYGQTMQQPQQPLGGQFDSSTYWASTGNTAAVTSSSPQPSDCNGGGGMRSSGQQREEQQSNTSCDSIILHHHQQHSSKNRREGEDTLFHNSGTDLSADQMYTDLHGLFSKSLETPAHGGAIDPHHQQQLAICSDGAKSPGRYGDHSSWSQFTVNPSLSGISSHGGDFMGIQEVVDRTTFDSGTTPDSLSTVTHTTRRDELSPSSAGTAMSAIHNFRAGAAGSSDLSHAQLPYRSSSSADLDCSDIGLQRKRPLPRGNEQVGESSVSAADESAKRSRIVRCLWEQNIAQLQLANLPAEHHRNLWQLQSQAVFGRLPGSFLMGGSSSSNSGSMDMATAVGPALNTNGRPRARRGSATDPQSVYARHRRERINDRLKVLQHLVPNGAKVDIVTMLEEAINYVKFLQLQVRLLSSDELWYYAPTTYNGVDVSMGMHTGLLNQQA